MQCDNRAGGVGISIHALHEESDRHSMARFAVKSPFQSTLSMRRATHEFIYLRRTDVISIHALHEESDYYLGALLLPCPSISIHALHEESDHVTGGDTWLVIVISIHALHEESDSATDGIFDTIRTFQSTLSMRRATRLSYPLSTHAYFNPRSP